MERSSNDLNNPSFGMDTFAGVPMMYSPPWFGPRPTHHHAFEPAPYMMRGRGGPNHFRGFRVGGAQITYRAQDQSAMPMRYVDSPPQVLRFPAPKGAPVAANPMAMPPSNNNPPASSWVNAKPFCPRQPTQINSSEQVPLNTNRSPEKPKETPSYAPDSTNSEAAHGHSKHPLNAPQDPPVPRRSQAHVGSGRTWHSRGGGESGNGARPVTERRGRQNGAQPDRGSHLRRYRDREQQQQRGSNSDRENTNKVSRQPKTSSKGKDSSAAKYQQDDHETPSFNTWLKDRFGASQKGDVAIVPQKNNVSHVTQKDDVTSIPQKNNVSGITQKDDVNQRDRLIQSLTSGKHECMVCCDRVTVSQPVWSCTNCYHVFHLTCVRKWANSSAAFAEEGKGWRCPACQNVNDQVPNRYLCFCGKVKDPEWNRYDTPHSCGERCGKELPGEGCTHFCNILCHPGRCPTCQVQVTKTCPCGNTSRLMRCGQSSSLNCGQKCGKPLDCGAHECAVICHSGKCSPCEEIVTPVCFCGKETREALCSTESRKTSESGFSCDAVCGQLLLCGNHPCVRLCHEGACGPCPLLPETSLTCACGQTAVSDLGGKAKPRASCLDPIPVCNKKCGKRLPCSTIDSDHYCKASCHLGVCPPCPLVTEMQCRCGAQKLQVKCSAPSTSRSGLCHRRCTQKLVCGRHRCNQLCCVNTEHRCTNVCGRKLTCGLHTCQEECHRGNCHQCWNTSFDELTCYCGATVKYPPIPCGTRPPECDRPCSRVHNCEHPVTHNCHNNTCPPCTFLTEKECYGKHEVRKHIPCYLEDVCCGMPCAKPLECGHKCTLTCHKAPCLKDGVRCVQPCASLRPACGHPCGLPCHPGVDCPSSNCKAEVTMKCSCGHRSEKLSCKDSLIMLRKAVGAVTAGKLRDIASASSQSMDISDNVCTSVTNCRLECNADCTLLDRNRRIALALQIRNPELTNKLGPPAYSDFLKDRAKTTPAFVSQVFERLSELVRTAKQSKQKNRSFSFPPSNRDHRRVIHELAEFFGCETVSYDEEPNRNVVATAFRDKSWLPSMSLMAIVERDSGQKKFPKVPVQLPAARNRTLCGEDDDPVKTKMDGPKLLTLRPKEESKPSVDYFDYDG